jgi:pimeloyl-ACP methyl ester carboxylesterase
MVDVVGHEVESRGHRLAYLTWGQGPPLVLLSGVLQAAEDWVTAGYSDALGDFSVVAIDPLGFGASDKPHDPSVYRLDGRVVDIDTVLDAERVTAAAVWGYSFGGIQAEAYARLRPERTRAVVVGGMVPGLDAVGRENVGAATISIYESGDWCALWRDAMPFVPERLRAAWEERNDLLAVAASARGSWEAHPADGRPLPTPLFCYVGTDEWFWEVAAAMVAVPGASFAPLEGADHADAFEEAAAVTALVRPFLEANV